jgi:hypothetical protein
MDATRPEAGPLESLLAVERELAELIGSERRKAAQWLEERKREIDATAKAELARLAQTAFFMLDTDLAHRRHFPGERVTVRAFRIAITLQNPRAA